MPEQHRHLANQYEDIVNLQGEEAYCVATRTACWVTEILLVCIADYWNIQNLSRYCYFIVTVIWHQQTQ